MPVPPPAHAGRLLAGHAVQSVHVDVCGIDRQQAPQAPVHLHPCLAEQVLRHGSGRIDDHGHPGHRMHGRQHYAGTWRRAGRA